VKPIGAGWNFGAARWDARLIFILAHHRRLDRLRPPEMRVRCYRDFLVRSVHTAQRIPQPRPAERAPAPHSDGATRGPRLRNVPRRAPCRVTGRRGYVAQAAVAWMHRQVAIAMKHNSSGRPVIPLGGNRTVKQPRTSLSHGEKRGENWRPMPATRLEPVGFK
jgi:hypothetical protein